MVRLPFLSYFAVEFKAKDRPLGCGILLKCYQMGKLLSSKIMSYLANAGQWRNVSVLFLS